MALNPVVFTEKVLQSFLRYQLRAYPFADPRLNGQMRELLSLDEARRSPLLRGPFVSLSRPFRTGSPVADLAAEGLLHPHLEQRIPEDIESLYRHQEQAIRAIAAGRSTLVSTGTGSGKTECFLYPVVSRCLKLRDEGAPAGISAVIVYPMNALAEDQLMRLRSLLAGTGVSFGMYVGKTPENESGVAGIRLPRGASRADYEARLAEVQAAKSGESVFPPEEACSREAMRSPDGQPRILLTNVKQLELLLTRQRDAELFHGARLDFLVFDEAHTFTGAMGAETACLIRRLRAFCGRRAADTVCVATSATIVDPERPGAARAFASRFFGVPEESVETVGEDYEPEVWSEALRTFRPGAEAREADAVAPAGAPSASGGRGAGPEEAATGPEDAASLLAACVEAVEDDPDGPGDAVRAAYRALAGDELAAGVAWPEALYAALARSEIVYRLNEALHRPRPLHELPAEMRQATGREVAEAEILAWLTLAAAARSNGRPLLRPVVHGFVRGIPGAVVSFPDESGEPRLWLAAEDEIEHEAGGAEAARSGKAPRLSRAAEDETEHREAGPGNTATGAQSGREAGTPSGRPPTGVPRGSRAARESAAAASTDDPAQTARLPVLTCTTCGQHYFEAHLQDFSFDGRRPGGGEPSERGVFWPPLDEALGGRRVVLVDRLIGGDEEDGEDEDRHGKGSGRRDGSNSAGDPAPGRRDANGEAPGVLERRTAPVHLCRHCGAAHERAGGACLGCGAPGLRVRLHAVRQKRERPGVLTSCLSCNALGGRAGGRYREPARPVRASNAADVHVLAQDMVHHSARPRLLVFCDNRQDAAFQAGWMKDHARRFRLRSLMADGLGPGGCRSVGDLTWFLDDALEKNEALSRALIPEVWVVARPEAAGRRHRDERLKFLRMQVLQEVAESARQPLGLEPWGRMKVDYAGLDASLPWIRDWANRLGLPPESMREGVAAALDYVRRRKILHDGEYLTFTKYRLAGDLEMQQGYLRRFGGPRGVKLQRGPGDAPGRVLQWLSDGGQTTMKQMAAKWGAAPEQTEDLLRSLFEMLTERGLLRPVRLVGAHGRPLPNASGVCQVDGDRLELSPHHGVYRCRSCRARSVRRTPHDRCPAWRCNGTLEWLREDPDDYDLQLLDGGYSMLRPEEHTAMVPHQQRERLENLFKGGSDAVNCFVCTATLELGVDIGSLDAVLMRNVPPLPANYWQRAGRAGRRHRMAVDLTYCRPVSHDRAYFAEPEKLLAGRVDPPAFNLSNDVMVRKHVNACVLTGLQRLARQEAGDGGDDDGGRRPDAARTQPATAERHARGDLHERGELRERGDLHEGGELHERHDRADPAERERIRAALEGCLPRRVSSWLFDGGSVRAAPFDFGPLAEVVRRHRPALLAEAEAAFGQGWPEVDAAVVAAETLGRCVDGFATGLDDAARSLRRRLNWALAQIERLHETRRRRGSLDPEDDALFRRCDRLVKRLKGQARPSRRDAQGQDDANTFNVLAAQGFLPGYGLETGSVQAMAEVPFWHSGALAFNLPRPTGMALREYVPGNLIYANGHRFVARRFLRSAGQDREEMPAFEVSIENQAVRQCDPGAPASLLGAGALRTLAVCDVDLMHQSQISDDEDYRFQMPVAVHGIERGGHRGGRAFRWGGPGGQAGGADALLRHGVELRLVNVGSSSAIGDGGGLGYPVCTVCGQSVSPLSSERQQRDFAEKHAERCGRPVNRIGFHADIVADVFSLPDLPDPTTAYSVLEALRFGAAQVLEMHLEDLQVLVAGHVDRPKVDALLWDPMPGGSGLLDQLAERWGEVVRAAEAVVGGCASACGHSCIDCLQTFRNGYFHGNLDRHVALTCLRAWGRSLSFSHAIPAAVPAGREASGQPVNEAERRLRQLLLAAGFDEGIRGEQISLGPGLKTTTPDVVYRGDGGAGSAGGGDSDAPDVCIYLDGLSEHLHGNSRTAEQDREIRYWLRQRGYEVVEITVMDLDDAGAMTQHFRRLARYLDAGEARARVKDDAWFAAANGPAAATTSIPEATATPSSAESTRERRGDVLRFVQPTPETRYRTCVPFVDDLQAVAGDFSEAHGPLGEPTDPATRWVEVDSGRPLAPGMFAAQVVGRSMAPRIPAGSTCLFRSGVAGTRNGRIVLARLRDAVDPETGERFTVKRYRSEKRAATEGPWRHVRIVLEPLNHEFRPIELAAEDEQGSGAVDILAEFVDVLQPTPST